MTSCAVPRLRVRTVEVGSAADLLSWLPDDLAPAQVSCWLREGDGLVGWGRAASCATHGECRFDAAEAWWQELSDLAVVEDQVGVTGTGLVSFGSFSFAAGSPRGGLVVVPRVLVGRRQGRSWVTTVAPEGAAPPPVPAPPGGGPGGRTAGPVGGGIRLGDGAVPARDWPGLVAGAIRRIQAGEVAKVVLARDVVARAEEPLAVAALLSRLAGRYAATWTFAVDGLVGATPEMLVRLQDGRARSRVLAGTLRRGSEPAPSVTETHPELDQPHRSDPRLRLVSSTKDLDEHAFAVRSVAEGLAPHCTSLEVPAEPFVLELPDVYHLASDLTGTVAGGSSSLRLAAALHPSAAVCGTPQDRAERMIAELEGMDRGRYAGPVGWMDAAGNGDWGIALRCGQVARDARSVRLFAGGGIVAASDPEAELAETEIKLAAMRHALGL